MNVCNWLIIPKIHFYSVFLHILLKLTFYAFISLLIKESGKKNQTVTFGNSLYEIFLPYWIFLVMITRNISYFRNYFHSFLNPYHQLRFAENSSVRQLYLLQKRKNKTSWHFLRSICCLNKKGRLVESVAIWSVFLCFSVILH